MANLLIPGLLALGGVLIGLRGQRSADEAGWLRDRRLDAAVELMTAGREFWRLVNNAYLAHPQPGALADEHVVAINLAGDILTKAVITVDLLGPNELGAKAGELRIAYRAISDVVVMDAQRRAELHHEHSWQLTDWDVVQRAQQVEEEFRLEAAIAIRPPEPRLRVLRRRR